MKESKSSSSHQRLFVRLKTRLQFDNDFKLMAVLTVASLVLSTILIYKYCIKDPNVTVLTLKGLQPIPGDSGKYAVDYENIQPSWTDFYAYIRETVDACRNVKQFGGQDNHFIVGTDGNYKVCLDEGVAPTPGSCTVLSFGINNEWSFDDAMEEYGCDVYSFDPTMSDPEHIRGKRVHFYPLGLGGVTQEVDILLSKSIFSAKCQVLTYRDILAKIGKTNSVIDYLKVDIEGFEIDFLENVLYDDQELLFRIKQIGMELHPTVFASENTSVRKQKYWRLVHKLRSLGFTPIFGEPIPVWLLSYTYDGKTESLCCYEMVWINNRFVKK
ncbi:probable methyltransferase-like protein 24 [Hyalella azteca]|uniref:Probable methyltransferase-like protein 24 n=1 Tax=Hyalella azteca TaxID=294128 RepID=A0A8B7NYN0_HYAAZ|nr:probable methyltransferase-like protein 24 [Hyalella azteca]